MLRIIHSSLFRITVTWRMRSAGQFDPKTTLLLLSGPLGCAIAVFTFLVLGFTRENYSSLKHPVSSLALEHLGWVQRSSFLLSGILVFTCAFGLSKTLQEMERGNWTAGFVASVGIGLIGAGMFNTDALFGYPEDEPFRMEQASLQGKLHGILSSFVFVGLPVAAFRFSRRFWETGHRGWAMYSLVSGISVLVFLLLAETGFKQRSYLADFAGAFQRISIIAGCAWLSAVALYIRSEENGKAITRQRR